jgi:hypothetical protein
VSRAEFSPIIARPQLDYAATDLQSLYESLNAGVHLDPAHLLSAPPDPASLLPAPPPTLFNAPPPDTPPLSTPSPKRTPGGSASRRRTSGGLSDDRDEEELERIRKKNRDAATKFRQRQRDLGSSLEARIAELSGAREGLISERDILQSEVRALAGQLNALPYHHHVALTSPGMASPGMVGPGYEVGYGEMVAENQEADGGLAELELSPTFSLNGLAEPSPDEYGCPPAQGHGMHGDQT